MFRSLYRRFFGPSRAIFRYWNGQRDVAADPLRLLRAVENDTEFNIEIDPALVDADDQPATLRMIACVRRAFNVKSFEEGGLLEAECLQLFLRLYEFLDGVKKNTVPSPTSSPPTESASSTASTDPAPTPTNSSSGSSETPSAPSCDKPPE
jgi:hypothetical protein